MKNGRSLLVRARSKRSLSRLLPAAVLCALIAIASGAMSSRFVSLAGGARISTASQQESSDGVWKFVDTSDSKSTEQQAGPLRAFRRLSISQTALRTILRQAPLEFSS